MADLNGKRIAILATDMFEQVELVEPRKALEDAGAGRVISLEEGEVQGFNHYDKADMFRSTGRSRTRVATITTRCCSPAVSETRTLRTDEDAVGFVRSFVDAGKPVAAICHAP